MNVDGQKRQVMIDSGCSLTLICENAARNYCHRREFVKLETMGGDSIICREAVILDSIIFNNSELGPTVAHILPNLPLQVDLVIGLDVILKCGLSVQRIGDCTEIVFGSGRPAMVGHSIQDLNLTTSDDRHMVTSDFERKSDDESSKTVDIHVDNSWRNSSLQGQKLEHERNDEILHIEDNDFEASFANGSWEAEWKWNDNHCVLALLQET